MRKSSMLTPIQLMQILLLVYPVHFIAAQPKGYSWNITSGIGLPVGSFSETHFPGLGASVSYSDGRFGLLPSAPRQKTSYSIHAGSYYFFGKEETVSGHPYSYPGYILVHLSGGLIYNHGKRTQFGLVAGPGMGIYNGSSRFTVTGTLSANYYIGKRIGISPAFILVRESGADLLGSFAINGCWAF